MADNFITFIKENNRTNKFNIHWQIVRTNARDIKNVKEKIKYVLSFLEKNPNKQNFDRVKNWIKMTGVAYKGADREEFEKEYSKLDASNYAGNGSDEDNDLSKIKTSDLEKVYADLSKRKYGFQYKSVPKDHTEFMSKLSAELNNRKEQK
jgi:hypothetical protein